MLNSVFEWPAWLQMWAIGVVVYFAIKLATMSRVRGWTIASGTAYFLTTPTLDPSAFVEQRSDESLSGRSGWFGLIGIVAGTLTWLLLVPAARISSEWLAGLLVMVGVVCTLHFGLFEFFTAFWRNVGVAVRPIMGAPLESETLAEFWGRHWNTAFRDAASLLLVRPLRNRLPAKSLLLVVFVVSGLVHDLVMSLPAGGWGLPTLYFLIQAVGQLLGKSQAIQQLGFSKGRLGTFWTAAWLLIPLPLLAHQPFCVEIMLPFYDACVAAAFARTPIDAAVTPHVQVGQLVQLGGLLQFSILVASAATPFLLDWKATLSPLPLLFRQMFWVYGAYIVTTIVALGSVSLIFPAELAGASLLGIAITIFTAVFWGVRLLIGLVGFDADPFLTTHWRRIGYSTLTVMFTVITSLYGLIAIAALLR